MQMSHVLLAFAPLIVNAVTTATFDVLSLNVAGLPQIINNNGQSNKSASAMLMGQVLSSRNYSVIHLQEVTSRDSYAE